MCEKKSQSHPDPAARGGRNGKGSRSLHVVGQWAHQICFGCPPPLPVAAACPSPMSPAAGAMGWAWRVGSAPQKKARRWKSRVRRGSSVLGLGRKKVGRGGRGVRVPNPRTELDMRIYGNDGCRGVVNLRRLQEGPAQKEDTRFASTLPTSSAARRREPARCLHGLTHAAKQAGFLGRGVALPLFNVSCESFRLAPKKSSAAPASTPLIALPLHGRGAKSPFLLAHKLASTSMPPD